MSTNHLEVRNGDGEAFAKALHDAAAAEGKATIDLAPGTYYLPETARIDARLSGLTIRAKEPGSVTLSGGRRLECTWTEHERGIWKTPVPSGLAFDQLFVDGVRQTRARFPNYDPSDPKSYTGYTLPAGKIPDDAPNPQPNENEDMTFSSGAQRGITYDPASFSSRAWARPEEAVIHIYQAHYWGNLQWRISHIDRQKNEIWFGHGGHQLGAKWSDSPCEVNERSYFYIENVFEELDAPGEWYLDTREGVLFFYPPEGTNLDTALFEVPVLETILDVRGSQQDPVRDVTITGIRFAHTKTTFLDQYDIPSLSDWAIHRGGAVFFSGTRDCRVDNCFFDATGGNAVFINDHNRGAAVENSTFSNLGDSAVCLVGSLNTTVGTQRNFPYECRVHRSVGHDCGYYGKQVAGVYISRAKRITVSHNEMFSMPRAGICIGDGTWGGHIIEHNYIHDTCRETGDHGPFNAWGRDKYWCLVQSHTEYLAERNHDAGHVLIDAMEPVVMRYNFFREETGWGLDLDDGASNYEIYSNLCVGVSVKLREGAHRTIYNNIWVNGANSPCFHVGNEHNHDRYFRNITVMSKGRMKTEDDLNFEMGAGGGEIYTLIAPPSRSPWLEECDHNCFYSDIGEFKARASSRIPTEKPEDADPQRAQSFHLGERTTYTLSEWQAMGYDRNSVFADPMFVDPDNDDYRVKPESPALELGFENFAMDQFGLTADYPTTWRNK